MKKVISVILVLCLAACLCGCNRTIFDTTWKFDEAILELPDGTIVSGPVVSWTDYEDGDQIQVRIGDKTYLVHSSNITLIAKDPA